MNYKLVSIIIPTYNYGEFIKETIDSIINQTYSNWECLIIDDGSTDNTRQIVEDYSKNDPRIQYFFQKNAGRSEARYRGVLKSKGELIQFLDADDLLHKEKLQKQVTQFIAKPDIDIIYSDFNFIDEKNNLIQQNSHFTKALSDPIREIALEFAITGFIITIHSAIFKKEIILNQNYFPSDLEVREDWFLWLNMALLGRKFLFLNEKLAYYRKHNKSTVLQKDKVVHDFILASFKGYEILPEEIKPEFASTVANYLRNIILNTKIKKEKSFLFKLSYKIYEYLFK